MSNNAASQHYMIQETFARLVATESPSLDDLKQLCLLEASGQVLYDGLCAAAPNDAVRRLLARNGQEEMGHAHRVKRVIGLLYGEDFAIPAHADNPYCAPPTGAVITAESLNALAQGELGGEAFYGRWANTVTDEKAAKLLRQNGKEETRHGERLLEAIQILS